MCGAVCKFRIVVLVKISMFSVNADQFIALIQLGTCLSVAVITILLICPHQFLPQSFQHPFLTKIGCTVNGYGDFLGILLRPELYMDRAEFRYWWVLIFLLLLLLLCCILCLLAWCCMRGRRKRRDSQYSGESFTPSNDRIYTVDDAVQTLPELKQAAQQGLCCQSSYPNTSFSSVNMHESYSRTNYIHPPQQEYAYSLRQFDNHGAIDLHPESGTTRRAASAAYTNHVYDGDFYEEDLHERAFTKYGWN